MFKNYLTKQNVAIFLAILFHFSGVIGILFSSNKDWFIANTPLNLVLMTLLLLWTQPNKNVFFFAFFIITYLVGMGVEMIGVNTGKLFGNYHYGMVMGTKLNGVPYLIGLTWFTIIYCSGVLLSTINDWVDEKTALMDIKIKSWLQLGSFVLDGALLTTMFDYYLEPVAIKLQYWTWKNNIIPNYNYICWFGISALLLLIFKKMEFNKNNQFAIHLLVIQFLFFIALQIYMK